MNSNSIWTQFFNVPKDAIDQWQAEAADKKSLLLWCLEKGALEPHEYLTWARGNYNLPSVGTQFFNVNKDFNFWPKLKSETFWSEEFAPISEWDGVVYVGCLQPPQSIDFNFPVQFVLVHMMDLKSHWKTLNPASSKKASADANMSIQKANEWESKLTDWANTQSQAEDMPPALGTQSEPSTESFGDGEFTKITLEAEEFKKEQTATAIKAGLTSDLIKEMPSEIVAEPVIVSAPTLDSAPPPIVAKTPVVNLDHPEGIQLNLKTDTPSAKPYDPLEELRKSLGVSDEPAAQVKSDVPASLDAPEGMNFTAKKETDISADLMPEGFSTQPSAAPAPVIQVAVPVLNLSTPVVDVAPTVAPAPTAIPVVPPIETAPPVVASTPISNPATSSTTTTVPEATGTYTGFLAEFYTHFQSGMVIDVENETYIPVMWNEGFKRSTAESVKRYSLNEASCFRIAFRTQMPYIGYVVDTPQNKDFFTGFGFSELPKTVLVQPVMVNKKVIALLLATFDVSKKTHHIVAAGEALAKKFIENHNLYSKKAA